MPPAVEPVSVLDAKEHLRAPGGEEDFLIAGLIVAARQHVELITNRCLITQTVQWNIDAWPLDGILRVPRGPLQSVSSITYIDPDGASQTLASGLYRVDAVSEPARITPVWGQAWPSIRPVTAAITVTFVAGFGSAPATVPGPIISAIKMLIGELFREREASAPVALSQVPFGVQSLLWNWQLRT